MQLEQLEARQLLASDLESVLSTLFADSERARLERDDPSRASDQPRAGFVENELPAVTAVSGFDAWAVSPRSSSLCPEAMRPSSAESSS